MFEGERLPRDAPDLGYKDGIPEKPRIARDGDGLGDAAGGEGRVFVVTQKVLFGGKPPASGPGLHVSGGDQDAFGLKGTPFEGEYSLHLDGLSAGGDRGTEGEAASGFAAADERVGTAEGGDAIRGKHAIALITSGELIENAFFFVPSAIAWRRVRLGDRGRRGADREAGGSRKGDREPLPGSEAIVNG